MVQFIRSLTRWYDITDTLSGKRKVGLTLELVLHEEHCEEFEDCVFTAQPKTFREDVTVCKGCEDAESIFEVNSVLKRFDFLM
ncbi:Uncharacterised protein g8823 [Pycnogonum litorale]